MMVASKRLKCPCGGVRFRVEGIDRLMCQECRTVMVVVPERFQEEQRSLLEQLKREKGKEATWE